MKIIFLIESFLNNVYGFMKSLWILLFRSIKQPAILNGYCHKWFARMYRAKREIFWHRSWNQSGREQYILPFLPGKLIICSKMEMEVYKKKGLISKNTSIRKLTKRSI